MSALVRVSGLAAVAVAAAGWCSMAAAGGPLGPILEPVGGGVEVVYRVGASSVNCVYGRSAGLPQLACATRRAGGRGKQVFAALMDARQVVFVRVRAGRQTRLAVMSQYAGVPVYGPFRRQRAARIVELRTGETIGFSGTNIACTAEQYGSTPALRCLAHGPGGLPGPCCGPDYPFLVSSTGFFLTPRRLQTLLVVNSGVAQVNSATAATSPLPPPYRAIRTWYL
jgi:hypothetical protein